MHSLWQLFAPSVNMHCFFIRDTCPVISKGAILCDHIHNCQRILFVQCFTNACEHISTLMHACPVISKRATLVCNAVLCAVHSVHFLQCFTNACVHVRKLMYTCPVINKSDKQNLDLIIYIVDRGLFLCSILLMHVYALVS